MTLTPSMQGEARPPGDHTCGSTPAGDTADHCGQPAAWHILWTVQADHSLTCTEHMADALKQWVFLDRHPISPDCTMPGALWSWDGNRCEIPDMAAIATDILRWES